MHVIVAASQKGGAGKTTAIRNLAVADLEAVGGSVGMVDLDPQGTLTGWFNRRKAESPLLIEATAADLGEKIAALRSAKVRRLYIDTPPSKHEFLSGVLHLASLVLVPVRPSPDDLDAIGPTLDLIEEAGAPFAFVLMQAKPRTRLALATVPALAQFGRVALLPWHDRVDFPDAAARGLGVTEYAKSSPAADEVRGLLTYVNTQLGKRSRK
jgi:chromosome partitioning protein